MSTTNTQSGLDFLGNRVGLITFTFKLVFFFFYACHIHHQ